MHPMDERVEMTKNKMSKKEEIQDALDRLTKTLREADAFMSELMSGEPATA